MQAATTIAELATSDRSNPRMNVRALWGLTFDMSGGTKGAKRALGRPFDGEVRAHVSEAGSHRPP